MCELLWITIKEFPVSSEKEPEDQCSCLFEALLKLDSLFILIEIFDGNQNSNSFFVWFLKKLSSWTDFKY